MKIISLTIFLLIPFLFFGQNENLLTTDDWDELNQSLHLRHANISNELENSIKTTIDKINTVTGLKVDYWISNSGAIFSHPNFGIIINIQELKVIYNNSTLSDFNTVVSLIVAHEAAHQVQFNTYSAREIIFNCNEMKKVYECQADILAGEIFVQISNNDINEKTITDALKVLYSIGTPEYSFTSSHPSREDRRMAVGMGIGLGQNMRNATSFIGFNASLNEINNSKSRERLNVETHESSMSWSLRQAKRIVNYCMANSEGITTSVQYVNWNSDPKSPTVEYSFKYTNTGDDLVTIDMQVKSTTVQRKDMLNTLSWAYADAKNYKFNLGPGESYTIKGRQRWNRTIQDEIPILVYPPTQQELISFEGTKCDCNPEMSELSVSQAQENFTINQTFAIALSNLIEAAKIRYQGYLVGPYVFDDLDEKVYQTSLNLPGLEAATIRFPKRINSDPTWRAEAYSGNSLAMAREYYKDMIKKVRRALNDSEIEFTEHTDYDGNDDPSSPSHYFNLKEIDIDIHIMLQGGPKDIYSLDVYLDTIL